MSEHLRTYIDSALETDRAAGDLTLGYFRHDLRVEQKADQSPVTVADREAESLIRRRIEARFPTHAIVGEEHGVTGPGGATHHWTIDPIDGTRAFVRGVPLSSVLMGLEIEGTCRVAWHTSRR